MVNFEIGVSKEASTDRLKTSIWDREEGAAEMDDIARVHQPGEVSVDMDRHGSRDMTNWDLVSL